jgi:hypothetical protein
MVMNLQVPQKANDFLTVQFPRMILLHTVNSICVEYSLQISLPCCAIKILGGRMEGVDSCSKI